MKISEWRPMAHWNQVLALGSSGDEVHLLRKLCVALFADPRCRMESGRCARVCRAGRDIWMFDPGLVRLMVQAVAEFDDDLALFLRAVGPVRGIPLKGETVGNMPFSALLEMGLEVTQAQADYATDIVYTIGVHIGFGNGGSAGGNAPDIYDRGLLRMAQKVAKRRCPSKGSGLSVGRAKA